jgi:hypothetical protein
MKYRKSPEQKMPQQRLIRMPGQQRRRQNPRRLHQAAQKRKPKVL